MSAFPTSPQSLQLHVVVTHTWEDLGNTSPSQAYHTSSFYRVPPPSISGRVSRAALKAVFFGLLGYSLYWMGRRTVNLVLSLPAAQFCLQRVSEVRPGW